MEIDDQIVLLILLKGHIFVVFIQHIRGNEKEFVMFKRRYSMINMKIDEIERILLGQKRKLLKHFIGFIGLIRL